MEKSSGAAFCNAERHASTGKQRLLYPSACALNSSCTVALLSTVAGVRAYKLITASEQRGGAVVSPLHPHSPSNARATPEHIPSTNGVTEGAPPPPPALWRTPVFTATLVGDSSLVAVVFRAPPLVFVPSRVTVTLTGEVQRHQDGVMSPSDPKSSSESAAPADASASSGGDGGLYRSRVPAAGSTDASALVAAEAECRRYVYLFDGSTGTCLTALHFCGSPVLTLRANSSVLLVAAVDLFHLVDIRTLRYIRQQSMFKPLNRRGVLDLSAPVPSRLVDGGTTFAVAFPQSARGYCGDVTVLTLHSSPPMSRRQMQRGGHDEQASNDSAPVEDNRASAPPNAAAAANPSADGTFATTTPPMQQRTIPAHHHAVAHLRFRPDGRLLATASERGTTVKLFDSVTGALLVELQRGHRPAAVLSLAVQQDAQRIAALSANGTLHVFDCSAVVQSWEVSRKTRFSSPLPARGSYSPATAGGTSSTGKARADSKYKVTLLPHPAAGGSAVSSKSTSRRLGSALTTTAVASSRTNSAASPTEGNHLAPGVVAAVNDGWLSCESGFAADGQTVWVVQVQSTETQLQRAVVSAPPTTALSQTQLCVGSLRCFPLPSSTRSRSTGAVSPSDKGNEGCHYVLV